MIPSPVRVRSLPRLRTICVDETSDDPLTRRCLEGRPGLREGLRLLSATAADVGLLDIGANIGLISLVFAARDRDVSAIEANPINAALLRESAVRNGFGRLRIHEMAVSDRTGTLEFASHGPFGHVISGASPGAAAVTRVPAMRLDDWPAAGEVSARVLVKMDIEGHEPAALRGMTRFLEERRFPPLFVESNAHCLPWFGESPQSLATVVEELGYAVHIVRSSRWPPWGHGMRLHPWNSGMHQTATVENLLCVRPGDDRVIVSPTRPGRSGG